MRPGFSVSEGPLNIYVYSVPCLKHHQQGVPFELLGLASIRGCEKTLTPGSASRFASHVACLLACWLAGWLAGLLAGCCLACWLAGLLACWLAGLLACWLAGLLACWLAGLLACWLAGLLACWLAGLLACWLACILPSSWSGFVPYRGQSDAKAVTAFVRCCQDQILFALDSVLQPDTTLVVLDLVPSNAPFVARHARHGFSVGWAACLF